ncbi:MAG: 2-phospho-L-lactate transferase [Ilumatobacteraceae bacterium]
MSRRITVLCGGVGAARFLRALCSVVPAGEVTAIVNTGDDTDLHGLRISPDLDTVTYTLAGAIDPERGWGLVGETWEAMGSLARYSSVIPEGSTAGGTWFGLGDRDLATHLYRTGRLAEGALLTEVTAEIAAAWRVEVELLPMSDGRHSTMVTLADGGEVSFQDYFVRLRHSVPVAGVRFDSDGSPATPRVLEALSNAEVVVIAPSNPFVSIAPIRALDGVDQLLAARRESVVAVSPIVGGEALKGPAARMAIELGHSSDVAAVAALYAEIATALVIDPVDEALAEAVSAAGMRPVVVPSVMSDPAVAARLAEATIAAVR